MTRSTLKSLNKLRQFAQDKADTLFHTLERQWSYSIRDCETKGWAIEGVRAEQMKNSIGTPTAESSLWSVDDKSMAFLIERFYKGIQNGDWKAEALKQDQLIFVRSIQICTAARYLF